MLHALGLGLLLAAAFVSWRLQVWWVQRHCLHLHPVLVDADTNFAFFVCGDCGRDDLEGLPS